MNMIKLYGKPIRVNKASSDRRTADVGANLFIGNLDEEVDEKLLHDTFSAFGVILSNPKIMRDPESGNSKGFGFISYDSFDASDAAIEAMNGQYLCNKAITVSYAFKKDTKGERHGSAAGAPCPTAESLIACRLDNRGLSRSAGILLSPLAPVPHSQTACFGADGAVCERPMRGFLLTLTLCCACRAAPSLQQSGSAQKPPPHSLC